ncbi:MAG: FadR family transcriptional regulator [Bauldia sp.]|nr:FadR family transcriptional regulator [Bauldia sp.]
MLAAKGLIMTRRRTGSLVSPRNQWNLLDPDVLAWHGRIGFSVDFMRDLVEFRLLVEPRAAALAAQYATPEQIARIGDAAEVMRRNIRIRTAFSAAEIAFHVAVFAASGNGLLDRLSTIVAPLLQIGSVVPSGMEINHAWAVGRHDRVFMAIAERDAEAAQAMMYEVLAVHLAEVDSTARRNRDAVVPDGDAIPDDGWAGALITVDGLYPSRALHGKVAHLLGTQIVSGIFREGATLPKEAELAGKYKVSRQAVREALKVLAAKGLVATRRRAGTSVVPREDWNLLDPDVVAWHRPQDLPRDFLDDLVELRRLVEPAAAAIAAERRTLVQLQRISMATTAMRHASDLSEWVAADVAFHIGVAAASGNTLIESLSRVLAPLLEASIRERSEVASVPMVAVNRHVAIEEAIRDGDAEAARKATVAMLDMADRQLQQSAAGGLRRPA